MMKVGDSKPAYFAVASPPGVKPMEFLIKSVPDTASGAICDMGKGGWGSGAGACVHGLENVGFCGVGF